MYLLMTHTLHQEGKQLGQGTHNYSCLDTMELVQQLGRWEVEGN